MFKLIFGGVALVISLLIIGIPIYRNYKDDKIKEARRKLEYLYNGVKSSE
jgi:hypothetical protein